MTAMSGQRVLIIHFRVGRTDGVSLEISAWQKILTNLGANVFLASGRVNVGADFVVSGLETQLDQKVFGLDEEAFGKAGANFAARFLAHQQELVGQFKKLVRQARPDRIIVSNIFAVGENLAAAGALTEVLAKSGIPVLAIHHDFYWENPRYRRPSCSLVEDQLEKYFPPTNGWLKHACINSIARKELARRKGVLADLIYDTLDFNTPNRDANGACARQLRSVDVTPADLVVLQATRIVRRKNIELSMDLTRELQSRLPDIGKKRTVLVMAGYAEKRDEPYQRALIDYAKTLGIKVVKLNGVANGLATNGKNSCSLFGVYPYADVVTYPSQYEGFGNQFLEAVHAKKPVVVYEYPVFKSDIKPKGFEVISLGDRISFDNQTGLVKLNPQVLAEAALQVVKVLKDPRRLRRIVDKNFNLGRKYFSYRRTGQILARLLN